MASPTRDAVRLKLAPLFDDESSDDWNLKSWVKGAGTDRVVTAELMEHLGSKDDVAAHMRGLESREELAKMLRPDVVVENLLDVIWDAVVELKRAGAVTNAEVMGKFAGAIEMDYGGLEIYFGGLEGFVGAPNQKVREGMQAEHVSGFESDEKFEAGNYGVLTTSKTEWLFVTDDNATPAQLGLESWPAESEAKLPDRSHCRERRPLADVKRAAEAQNAWLLAAKHTTLINEELIAARMYTGPVWPRSHTAPALICRHLTLAIHRLPWQMFVKYNGVLRGIQSKSPFLRNTMVSLCCSKATAEAYLGTTKLFEQPSDGTITFEEALKSLNKYTTTLHGINSAIIKLGKLTTATNVYRGVSGMKLPDEFWRPNEFGVKGGVERGFMSTTLDREVAMGYAEGDGSRQGIVIESKQGMVNRGADISWLSQYPHEKEILFGPLTGLEVLSTRIEGSLVIVHCGFSVNLTALTLEQVLGKRRNLVDQMAEQIADQVQLQLQGTGFAELGVARLKKEIAASQKDNTAEWYNEDANFRSAVDAVLRAKALVLGRARLEWISASGMSVEDVETHHAPFVLECARSGDPEVVRAVTTLLNSFESLSAHAEVDRIALEALHRATGGGGEVGRTERESSCLVDGSHVDHVSSRGLFLADKGWCTKAPLREWMGVTVDETGRVTGVQLKGCGLKGELPPELAYLTHLDTLDLRDNPDLAIPAGAKALDLLDVTEQMHFTDKARVQAFLRHVALSEDEKAAALLVTKLANAQTDRRLAAVETLGKLDSAALAQHAAALVARLKDSDFGVRQAALQTLGKLDAAALARHEAALVAMLEDSEWYVRQAALQALGKLDAAALAQHAAALVAMLEDSEGCVRYDAVETLGKLDAAALAQYAAVVVAMLKDSDMDLRVVAVETLGKLDAAALAQHAAALVAMLADDLEFVRKAAWEVLTKLGAEETLAQHAAVIVARLEDSDGKVQIAARFVLHKLEPAAGHMDALAAKLDDSDFWVREAALQTLGKLDAAALAQHAAALVAKLEDSNAGVRRAAVETLGKLDAAALAQHAANLVAKLADSYFWVRKAAWEVLAKLGAEETLAQYAAIVAAKLEDSHANVRFAAAKTLGKLDAAALAKHAAALVAMFEDSYERRFFRSIDHPVRRAAVQTMGKLDAAALAQHAAALVAKLADSDEDVRKAAWEVLTKLGAEETLAQHAAVIVAKLKDSDGKVQIAARFVLHKLEPAAGHMDALAAKLDDSDFWVREAALQTLGKLDAAALARHEAALVAMLEDSEEGVRFAAVETLGKLDAAALAQHAAAIFAVLEDSEEDLRVAVVETLGKLDAAALAQHEQALAKTAKADKFGLVRAAAEKVLAKL